ncbi:MAG TPA: AlkA N-terminal domain-containing protein [Candidatus Udaeobacter sp.]|jgi:AraC family transcriptional regulator of adaptative response / DNA-3-methyladenine glycosylase II|nr:AlkA N-terminal domain-containing protein [Candidatus Udaeobacter sp.]
MTLDPETCYRAFASRDRRFEGRFVTAVLTTRIYCRPGCPARLPRRRNIRFYACAAAAEEAGFRPCLRCRPDAAPGTPAWIGTSSTVNRALRLIDEGGLDGNDIESLADRLGVTGRHLRRLFATHLGASPHAVASTRRVHFARRLIDETRLPFGDVALSAGFSNVRRFNHAIRETFRRTPRELRRAGASRSSGGDFRGASARAAAAHRSPAAPARAAAGALTLSLRARPPFDGAALLEFLAKRAIPGLESVERGVYRRAIEIDGTRGSIAATMTREGAEVAVHLDAPRDLIRVAARLNRMFDLDADPGHILAHLSRDPLLARALAGRRDVRVPGTWDPFELAVRAILGQQISVRGAATLASRIVQRFGTPLQNTVPGITHAFPTPERLASADLSGLGLTGARIHALSALAAAVAEGGLRFDRLGALDEAVLRLRELPGIGEWTAQYIAMRGLSEPDAFPAGDLGLLHAIAEGGVVKPDARALMARAESWRPWRAYAVMALWTRPRGEPVARTRRNPKRMNRRRS